MPNLTLSVHERMGVGLPEVNFMKFGNKNKRPTGAILCRILRRFLGFLGTSMANGLLYLMGFAQGVPKLNSQVHFPLNF